MARFRAGQRRSEYEAEQGSGQGRARWEGVCRNKKDAGDKWLRCHSCCACATQRVIQGIKGVIKGG
jgi:hypothetical protein